MESQSSSTTWSIAFRTKCIDGITVNEKALQHYMETTVGIVTALNPVLGYEKATELAGEAYKSRQGNPRDHPREEDLVRAANQGVTRSSQTNRAGQNEIPKEIADSGLSISLFPDRSDSFNSRCNLTL